MMKENTRAVLEFLRVNNGADLTAKDIAAAMTEQGVAVTDKQVVGSFNSFVRKDWGYREEAQVLDKATGKYVDVKYLKLTDLGMTVNVDEEPAKASEAVEL